MTGLLEGRAAIVTGAGRGIGRAIAEALVAEGASVIVADNGASIGGDDGDPEVARETAKALGKKAIAFSDSVASPGVARHLVELAVKQFGGIDIVVNNAAILRDAFVFRADPRDWDAVIRNNLSAPFYLINAASAVMREQGKSGRGGAGGYDWGRIVNIVSSAGLYGNLGQAAYASAKAGLFGLTRVTAMDLARAQITANAVAPFARTRVTDIIQPANEAQKTYKERALKIGAHHVANLVTALCSPAGKGITGQLLGVRGREVFLFGQPRPVAKSTPGSRPARRPRWRRISAPSFRTNSPTSPPISKPSIPNLSSEEPAMSDPIVVKTVEELKSAPEEYREAVAKLVISHAINELYGAQVFDEPAIAYAPTPYAKWLTCRVAMEEYGHHVRFKQLGLQMGIPEERMMPGAGKRPLSIFEFPLKTWQEFVAIKLLADLAEILQVEDLLHCTFHPLRNLARATMPEERFHAQFGEDFTAELIKTPEGKATLQAAIDEYFPYLPSFFGGSKSKNNEIFRKWNIKQRTNDEMRQDFMKRATEVTTKYGLTLPEVRQAA